MGWDEHWMLGVMGRLSYWGIRVSLGSGCIGGGYWKDWGLLGVLVTYWEDWNGVWVHCGVTGNTEASLEH